VHLVGHSYGGVALHAVLARKDRAASLTLYEPSAFHLLKQLDAGAAAFVVFGNCRARPENRILRQHRRSAARRQHLRRLLGRGGRVAGLASSCASGAPKQQRHPAEQIGVILADGRRVNVRPSLPPDIDLLRAFFRTLSDQARYVLFMSTLGELSERMARRFTDIVQARHVALLAYATNAVSQNVATFSARMTLAALSLPLRWPLTGKD
jgi:pimeloyl-ACP methyl ester carboxylesterase